MRKSGVKEFPETPDEMNRRSEFFAQYRRWFFIEPRGEKAFEDCGLEESLFIEPETIAKVESFHFKFCLHCRASENIKLGSDEWNYFFECVKCKKRLASAN